MTDPRMTPTNNAPVTVKRMKPQYPDYCDDPGGLEYFRQQVRNMPGHDMAAVNHNSLGRLLDTIERLRSERDRLAALASAPAGKLNRDFTARRIKELVDEGDGFWRACSGCQEGEDGYVSEKDYPFDPLFRCQPGGGCSECGGIGVLWDDGRGYGDITGDEEPASAPAGDGEPFTGVEAWGELVDVDDRTSPEEYPDMCLITRDELIDFMQRAAGQAIERHVRDALNDSEELVDGSVNITADHARRLNADVDGWEAAPLARPRAAVGEEIVEHVARAIALAVYNSGDSGVFPKWSDFRDESRAAILALQSPPAKVER